MSPEIRLDFTPTNDRSVSFFLFDRTLLLNFAVNLLDYITIS